MAKLHVGGKHVGAGADAPGDNGLGDLARLDGLAHLVLLRATDLAKEDEHPHLWLGLGLRKK